MAELETKEPGGDREGRCCHVGFQTALSFPTLSAGSNQGREAGYMQAGFVHRTKGKADRQDQQAGVRLAHHMPQPYLGTHRELYS